jgi:hypothetical protein
MSESCRFVVLAESLVDGPEIVAWRVFGVGRSRAVSEDRGVRYDVGAEFF